MAVMWVRENRPIYGQPSSSSAKSSVARDFQVVE